jgi:hypothetical protein
MKSFVALSAAQQKEIYEQAVTELGLPAPSIEKDFWVTWTLRELFALRDWGPRFTFKGGTSLSKCWKLIERFSEDIDVVIDREFLGFGGETLSGKKLRRLREACSTKIRESLAPALRSALVERLPRDRAWSLELASAEEDPDEASRRRSTLCLRPCGGSNAM